MRNRAAAQNTKHMGAGQKPVDANNALMVSSTVEGKLGMREKFDFISPVLRVLVPAVFFLLKCSTILFGIHFSINFGCFFDGF